jgi:hypothetical protein
MFACTALGRARSVQVSIEHRMLNFIFSLTDSNFSGLQRLCVGACTRNGLHVMRVCVYVLQLKLVFYRVDVFTVLAAVWWARFKSVVVSSRRNFYVC